MVNPDGVIIGNYRTSYSGNDLNRKYHDPDLRLHPTVSAIKSLVDEIINGSSE
jgi:murein tripeptide amidase MpaA